MGFSSRESFTNKVFYVDQGDLVRHVAEDVPFHFFVDVDGAETGMTCQAHTKIVSVDWTLSADGREVCSRCCCAGLC